jgi:hypothetical protein
MSTALITTTSSKLNRLYLTLTRPELKAHYVKAMVEIR